MLFLGKLLKHKDKRDASKACKVSNNTGDDTKQAATEKEYPLPPGTLDVHIAFHTCGNADNTDNRRNADKNNIVPFYVW